MAMTNTAFEGRIALITGGASGIGRATATQLGEAGAHVLVADLNVTDGAGTAQCDVSIPEQVEAAVAAAIEQFGGLDILINNAGTANFGPITETHPADFMRTLAVNVGGVFCGIKYAAPQIAARGGGAIVSTASTAGLGGIPILSAYAASKAAIINLTQTAALELRPAGIRVNCVLPGMIDTPMMDDVRRAFTELSPVPLDDVVLMKQGRRGEPDDIARALLYLASPQAEFISGVALAADNAMSASVF
jgi:NAD(P)-dependent dehydrogenase (short-subunit alcohol dehydrogenase family)